MKLRIRLKLLKRPFQIRKQALPLVVCTKSSLPDVAAGGAGVLRNGQPAKRTETTRQTATRKTSNLRMTLSRLNCPKRSTNNLPCRKKLKPPRNLPRLSVEHRGMVVVLLPVAEVVAPRGANAASRQLPISCAKVRKFWCRLRKNRSPKKARALLRTSPCPDGFWFTCRRSNIWAYRARLIRTANARVCAS